MAPITHDQAASYLARWQEVSRQEIAELRATSVEVKLRQLCALAAARSVVPADPDRSARAAEVAARWHRIRTSCGG